MRNRSFLFILLSVILVGSLYIYLENRHAKIEEWSSNLTMDKIDWAEVSKEYGIDKVDYILSEEDYRELLPLLRSVNESISSRKERSHRLEEGYRLAFSYEGKLWLWKCCENEIVSLMFDDAETGAYYGCEGKLLYIHSPELWHYIVNTVEEKAHK